MRYVFNIARLQSEGIDLKSTADSVVFEDNSPTFPIFHIHCFSDLRETLGEKQAEDLLERLADEVNGAVFMAKLNKAKMPAY